MTPDRWQKIEQIYHAALERHETERSEYLKIACDGDKELYKEVELLLLNGRMAENWLEPGALKEIVAKLFGEEGRRSLVGTQMGSYHVMSLIGTGGMGEVYEAFDSKLGRNVALKVLPNTLVSDENRLSRFRREAMILASLNHPNIATIHGLEQCDGTHYLVMELVLGRPLNERLRAGPLPISEALSLGIQIAGALEAAHGQGIIHRDIKPANIVVTDKGQAKILDFGLAKLTHAASPILREADESLSVPNALLGTVAYMSPEQIRGEELDIRTDLFSFGLVLYQMVTGVPAFNGSSIGLVFDDILNHQPVSPSQLNREVSPTLAEIVNKALEKDKGSRYQSAQQLRSELQRLRLSESQTSNAAELRQIRVRSYKKATLFLAVFACAALVLLLLMLAPRAKSNISNFYRITNDGSQKELPGTFYPILTDGARLYFTQIGAGDLRVAQVSASGGETISTNAPFRFPRMADISPNDAQLLLFGFSGSEPESTLWVQPILGGTPSRVGDLQGHDGTWTPIGDVVYANGSSLYEAGANGNSVQKLATVPGIPFWPRWSPDGRRLRFSVLDTNTNSTSLWELLAGSSNPKPLLEGWNDPPSECCGNWSPDSKYFAFQSTRDNQSNIWVLENNGALQIFGNRGPSQITRGPMNFSAPVFSRDGAKLFAVGEERRGELVRYDAKAHEFVPYLSGISADRLAFSRDGKWVTYVSYPDETLWRSNIDGGEKQQLTFPPSVIDSPEWSPDGRQIAFCASTKSGTEKVYLISSEGGKSVEIVPGKERECYPSWSADGDFLAFSGREPESAKSTIFVFSMKTRTVSVLPGSEGLFDPRWSPDGKQIAAMSMDSQNLMLFEIQTRTWERLAQVAMGYLSWSKDNNYLYCDTFGASPSFVRIGVRDRAVQKVVDLSGLRRAWGRYGPWSGLGPDDIPLATRDAGIQEIYGSQLSSPK